jgi:2-dehydro-3-deoxyphosphooctonate aldolase (KDO 8-P synthase)
MVTAEMTRPVEFSGITIGGGAPLALIAGPCVIESADSAREHAGAIKRIAEKKGIPFIFKASYDKANRSSAASFRGPGLEKGLEILSGIRDELEVPVLSDVHDVSQVRPAAEVLDIIQIPAFLCRQTDLLVEAAKTGRPVNIKKGQFMSPDEMANAVEKVRSAGNDRVLLTERGTSFGYNMLVNDFRGLVIMARTGCPVVYDATHSVQMPGGKGSSSGGEPGFVLPLSRAAVAVGCDALFLEVHKDPAMAKSDGPNMLALDELEGYLEDIIGIEKAVR